VISSKNKLLGNKRKPLVKISGFFIKLYEGFLYTFFLPLKPRRGSSFFTSKKEAKNSSRGIFDIRESAWIKFLQMSKFQGDLKG